MAQRRELRLRHTSEYLLVKQDPRVSRTHREVKFSEAIISKPRICRFFSFLINSYISGSTSRNESRPVHAERLLVIHAV